MHLIPGVLITVITVILKPLLDPTGYPPLLAFLLAVLLVGIPSMLLIMLWGGKRLNGRYGLTGVVLYREKVSWLTFIGVFLGAIILLYLLMMLINPLSARMGVTLFSWLPEWLSFEDATQYDGYPKNILVIVFTLQLLVTGLLLPWVEELYFRGFLLPRITRFGKLAPLLGGFLFGLYHLWQPAGFVGVAVLGAGLGYVAWWKKDIRLSISLHVFANALVRILLLVNILAM